MANKRESVYLCGPIAGLTLGQAGNWRRDAAFYLEEASFQVLDPLRKKYDILPKDVPLKDTYHVLGAGSRHVYERDLMDVRRSDVVFANLTGAKKPSIGSIAEISIARELRKFIVLVMEDEGNVHDHPFINEAASIRIPDFTTALNYLVESF